RAPRGRNRKMSQYSSTPGFPSLTLAGQSFSPSTSRVAVLGAGVMGPGIALVFAEHGFAVDLCETRQEAIDRGMASLQAALSLKVEMGLLSEGAAQTALTRVTPRVGSDDALRAAHLVIEAVTENADVKRQVYARAQALCQPDTVIWSNTSTMNVFELAE